jgi:hypothetical protein
MPLKTIKTSKFGSFSELLAWGLKLVTLRGSIKHFVYGLFLLILFNNMSYSTFASDHENYLLQFRRRIDPSFALNDWYVEKVQEHHFMFTEILVFSTKFLTLQQALYVLFVINFILTSVAVGLICRKVQIGVLGFLLAMSLIQLLDANTVGGVNFLPASSLPHYLSLSLFLLSYWAHISGYKKMLTCLIVVMFYVNFSTGFFAMLFFNMVWLYSLQQGKARLKNLILQNSFISLNIVFILFATNFAFIKSNVDRSDYAIYFELRAPHHYLYDFFTLNQYTLTICLLALIYFLQKSVRIQIPGLDTFVVFLISLFLLSVVSTILFIPEFLRLFPYRLFPLLIPFSAILLAREILRSDSKRSLAFWNLLTLLLLLVSKNRPGLNPYKWEKLQESHVFISLFLFLLVVSTLFSLKYFHGRQCIQVSLSVGIIFLLTIFAFPTNKMNQDIEAYDVNGLNQITRFVPEGETILVPPSAGEVRLLAQRAIVVDYGASPHDLNLMGFWKDRILRLSCGNNPDKSARGYELLDAISIEYKNCPISKLIQIAKDYDANYILVEVESKSEGKSLLEPVGRFGIYDLFRIP